MDVDVVGQRHGLRNGGCTTASPNATRSVCAMAVRRSAAALLLLLPFIGACQEPDRRISLVEFQELERHEAAPVVPVAADEVQLADVQPYRVQAGDVISITMFGLREDRYQPVQLQFRVYDDGTVVLPIVGAIAVGGKTLGEAEQAIIAAHKTVVQDLAVHVQLVGPDNTTVLVQGAVMSPGLITLPENERNILYALNLAGGFQNLSSGIVHYQPIHASRESLVFNLTDINDLRRALSAPPLDSGDIITVEAASDDAVYVIGLVNAPGAVAVPRNGTVSLVRAVAATGGLRDFLDPREATLWRKLDDGRQVRVKLSLEDIFSGQGEDIALRAGDVLEVPHTAGTRFREWVAGNIRIGPFGVTAMYDPVSDYRARILRNDNNNGTFRRTLLESVGTSIPQIVLPPITTP